MHAPSNGAVLRRRFKPRLSRNAAEFPPRPSSLPNPKNRYKNSAPKKNAARVGSVAKVIGDPARHVTQFGVAGGAWRFVEGNVAESEAGVRRGALLGRLWVL